jgi:hypothetical protein
MTVTPITEGKSPQDDFVFDIELLAAYDDEADPGRIDYRASTHLPPYKSPFHIPVFLCLWVAGYYEDSTLSDEELREIFEFASKLKI